MISNLRQRFKPASTDTPAEMKVLFDQYSESGTMTVDHLHRFMTEVQGEGNATVEDAQAILIAVGDKGLDLNSFFRYLFDAVSNSPLSPSQEAHQDMTAPVSHYYIYTGHNSYLTGNQLSSDCSDVPIIEALQRGVRVIELDIWPNSTEDNVDVLHGRTLTTPVELLKCLKSIKEHAFSASEYPVVITLEDHLTPDLQCKVAEMVTQTFGDMLFTTGSECLKDFPSPESLKKRIIISTKPPKEYLKGKEVDGNPNKSQKDSAEEAWGKEVPDIKAKMAGDDKDDTDEGEDEDEDEENVIKSQQNEVPEYRNLIAIHAGKGKGGLDEWLRVDPDTVRRLSLSEPQLGKAVLTHGKEIIRFTQRKF